MKKKGQQEDVDITNKLRGKQDKDKIKLTLKMERHSKMGNDKSYEHR